MGRGADDGQCVYYLPERTEVKKYRMYWKGGDDREAWEQVQIWLGGSDPWTLVRVEGVVSEASLCGTLGTGSDRQWSPPHALIRRQGIKVLP